MKFPLQLNVPYRHKAMTLTAGATPNLIKRRLEKYAIWVYLKKQLK